jgi:hypothetical protein
MNTKTIKKGFLAVALSAGLVTAAQAHMFVGVGIDGGPVFPVTHSTTVPPLPVESAYDYTGAPPLPPTAPAPAFAEPAVASLSSLTLPDDSAGYAQR